MPLLILIAEDDAGIRLAINDYLELSGYWVITAEDGEQALNLLDKYHPHLLISDIKMPGKDGYELVRQVRQRPELRLIPVIFLTEYNSTEQRILGYQTGCDIYLPKPFEMEELGAMIRNLLERAHAIESEIRYSQVKQVLADSNPTKSVWSNTTNGFHLSNREKEVLNLITTGLSNIEIGESLFLSPRTIEKYVSSLLRKTQTNNRAELVRFALEKKLLDENS
ncbi:two component transcriptional regulator, LuxR family [Stanieria cyanosphaera PCC 7437]|uniref:Two component transcriptional regulator, LuxR family n=1 Tax=Stanieria cyanosphaera (strain ATCC 29371 / PCC 7437) TaxID=111780 RepID=K9XV76_STAC7|nr:response regulator transcription factor [Stanieria cyanosphaera]AFZ35969.1 two component transcriptional regulator, LuxR family [Stanieria cyanosphaera PCC 7437]